MPKWIAPNRTFDVGGLGPDEDKKGLAAGESGSPGQTEEVQSLTVYDDDGLMSFFYTGGGIIYTQEDYRVVHVGQHWIDPTLPAALREGRARSRFRKQFHSLNLRFPVACTITWGEPARLGYAGPR